jgi:8-amino-7-oxononanoate synthase
MNDMMRHQLDVLDAQGLRRSLRTVASSQGREIILDGKKVLNFCSNDYLGLAADPRLVRAAEDAMKGRGFGAGASRLVCGNSDEHDALEKELAAFKHVPEAVLFSSGYMANTGIIPALVSRGDAVFSDRLNHASIVDGIVLSRADLCRYPHKDMNVLDEMLAKATGARRKVIVTDTVFSMDGDIAPLKDIVRLAKQHNAWLMVDEAHAFGVFGLTGAGLVEEMGLEADVQVQMGTLSKAAGAYGAYCAGGPELKEYLINSARSFIFTTALPPAVAAAARCALNIIKNEPQRRARVLALALRMRDGLKKAGFDSLESETPIIPVLVRKASVAVEMSKKLLERGIFVSAIRPPTVPAHTARLRVTVTAAHTDEDIDVCLEAFEHAR